MAYIGQGIKQGTFKVLDTSGNTYNGSNTTFSLGTQVGSAAQLLVSHDGVIQLPGTDYTLASGGASITFSTAPASGASIFIVEISGAVGGTVTPSDTSVTADKLNSALLTGQTDIGANIADADLFLVDDGAGGTLRKTAASRIKTYVGGFDVTSITGATALSAAPDDTDEFVLSDAGTLKRIDYSDMVSNVGNWEKLTESTLSSYNADTKDDETAAMFSGNHDLYRYYIYDYQPQNDNSYLSIRFRINGDYKSDNNYEYHMQKTYSGSSSYTAATSAANTMIETIQNLGNASDERHMMMVEYHRPNTTTHYHMIKVSGISMRNDNDIQTLDGVGYYRGSTNILNGLRFFASAGNLENWHLVGYGLKSP